MQNLKPDRCEQEYIQEANPDFGEQKDDNGHRSARMPRPPGRALEHYPNNISSGNSCEDGMEQPKAQKSGALGIEVP